jgi:hypothetical protein
MNNVELQAEVVSSLNSELYLILNQQTGYYYSVPLHAEILIY